MLLILITVTLLLSNNVSGRISLYSPYLKQNLPLQGVNVNFVTHGKTYSTYTDKNGKFNFPVNSKGSFELKLINSCRNFIVSDNDKSTYTIKGPQNSSNWNLVIRSKKDSYYARVYFAAENFINSYFVDQHNIYHNLIIYGRYDKKKGGGPGTARYNFVTQKIDTWAFSKNGNPFSEIKLFGFLVHEMAHAQHDYVYNGKSTYRNTSLRLKETWAEAVKYFLTKAVYGEKSEEVKTFSKQYPVYSGWRNYSWNGRLKKYYRYYTPLMIDLVDDYHQQGVEDKVSGYNLKQFVTILSYKDCVDFDSFKKYLKRDYNNPTEKYVDKLFRDKKKKK